MAEHSIYPLTVGINETDQGIMTYLRDYGKRILLPIYVFYIRAEGKKILVDTGLEEFMVSDAVRAQCDFDILEFEPALARFDLKPSDIDIIIHTHLHNDHCENDYKCPQAAVYVQQKELDFLRDPHPVDHRYYPDILDDNPNVVTVTGDTEILPGIELIFSPGHSPGGQSVAVDTAQGRAIITGFCCNEKNFPPSGPAIPSGVHIDLIAAYESAQKIRRMADILIPLHALSVGSRSRIPGE